MNTDKNNAQLPQTAVSGSLNIGADAQVFPLVAKNSDEEEVAVIHPTYFKLSNEEKNKFLSEMIKWCALEVSTVNCH